MAASASASTTPTSTPKWGQVASPSAATPSPSAAPPLVPKLTLAAHPAIRERHFSRNESLRKRDSAASGKDVTFIPEASPSNLDIELDRSHVSHVKRVREDSTDKRSSSSSGDENAACFSPVENASDANQSIIESTGEHMHIPSPSDNAPPDPEDVVEPHEGVDDLKPQLKGDLTTRDDLLNDQRSVPPPAELVCDSEDVLRTESYPRSLQFGDTRQEGRSSSKTELESGTFATPEASVSTLPVASFVESDHKSSSALHLALRTPEIDQRPKPSVTRTVSDSPFLRVQRSSTDIPNTTIVGRTIAPGPLAPGSAMRRRSSMPGVFAFQVDATSVPIVCMRATEESDSENPLGPAAPESPMQGTPHAKTAGLPFLRGMWTPRGSSTGSPTNMREVIVGSGTFGSGESLGIEPPKPKLRLPASSVWLQGEKDSQIVKTEIWPHHGQIRKEIVERSGLYSLQEGVDGAVAYRICGSRKMIRDVVLEIGQNECILFDSNCETTSLRNVNFEGGSVVCLGDRCNITMENVNLKMCSLLVLEGATVTVDGSQFTASLFEGSGICALVDGRGSSLSATDCSMMGGLQCVAVCRGAAFAGDSVTFCESAVMAIGAKDEGSLVMLQNNSTITNIDLKRRHSTYEDFYSKGVYVHQNATVKISDCTISKCVRGVHVNGGTATANRVTTESCTDEAFRVENGGSMELKACKSEWDGQGCWVSKSAFKASGVTIRNSQNDGFHISLMKGVRVQLEECSAQHCGYNGVVLSGAGHQHTVAGTHSPVSQKLFSMKGGKVLGNGQCGVYAWSAAEAVLEGVESSDNVECGFKAENFGSMLDMRKCTSRDTTAYKRADWGRVLLHQCSPER